MTARPRRTPGAQVRNDLDIWLQSSTTGIELPEGQPRFTFPQSNAGPPLYSSLLQDRNPSPNRHSDFSKKPIPVTQLSPKVPQSGGAFIGWRDANEKFAAQKRKKSGVKPISRFQMATASGTIFTLIVLYLLTRGGKRITPIPHMKEELRQENKEMAPSARTPSPSIQAGTLGIHLHSFRDQLNPHALYITSPVDGKFEEQVYHLYHLTHLAHLLNRHPLLESFAIEISPAAAPTHVPVSQIFDMVRFRSATNIAAVDWLDIKPPTDVKADQLGCWISGTIPQKGIVDRSDSMREAGVDATFFPLRFAVPTSSAEGQQSQLELAHDFIRVFDSDISAKTGLIEQALHSKTAVTLSNNKHKLPESHIFCVDSSLYAVESPMPPGSIIELSEHDYGAFYSFGKHFHFTPELSDVANEVVATLLGFRPTSFISVVISDASHKAECARLRQDPDCAISLSVYSGAVDRIRQQTAAGRKSREQRHTTRTTSVLVSTDIEDLAFRGELSNLGWVVLDSDDLSLRQQTSSWPAVVIDSVIHSKANGFVGTKGNRESELAALRVKTWRNGPIELV